GYLDQTVTGVSVQAGQTTWLNFTLTQLGTISGTVTESDGTPIAGVNVSVDGTGRWALTDGSGNYAIQVEPGTYSLTATKAGYATQRRSGVVVTAGGVSDVDMIMYRLGGFIGVVVDGITGAPIPGTLVEAIQGGSVIGSDTTNAAGQYSIPNLPAGLYDVRATTPLGQSQTSFNEMIVAGQNTTVNFAFI
ncbi:MAG: carboxypeptidase-like regulatory domain-containing protein, partial [Candidatus Micrarchaeia archaeon]